MSESSLVQQGEERDPDRAVEHEGRLPPAPLFRLPAREPLAADHHEAAEPERETEAEPGESDALCGVELRRPGAEGAGEDRRAGEAEQSGDAFDGDDHAESEAVRERRSDGAALEPGV